MINEKKAKTTKKKWEEQNRAAQRKLKKYREEEVEFMSGKKSKTKSSVLKTI